MSTLLLRRFINFASRALQPLASILEQHEDEDSPVDLPRNVLESLQEVQSFLYSCLHATSDALHLVGMDGSELERQRDDLYLEGSTGNKAMRVQRPNSDPVRMEKDTSALDKLADDERRRQKELASARRPRSPGPAHAPRGTSPNVHGSRGVDAFFMFCQTAPRARTKKHPGGKVSVCN